MGSLECGWLLVFGAVHQLHSGFGALKALNLVLLQAPPAETTEGLLGCLGAAAASGGPSSDD